MVGTHGQLKNLYSKRILKFQAVRIVVFDEADEMLKVRLQLLAGARRLGLAGNYCFMSMMCGHCYNVFKACHDKNK